MNAKEEVIAMMRSSVTCGIRPGSSTLTSWANTLEQDEQQTPPSPEGRDCAGESSVQPVAIIAILNDEAREWHEGVQVMKEHKLDFRCELASAKALERAIKRIQREARS